MVLIPASITIENAIVTLRHRLKSGKITIYRRPHKRAVVRITGANFVKKLSSKGRLKKQVKIKFSKNKGNWILALKRSKSKSSTLQTYIGLQYSHPYLQLILNRHLPKEFWREHELSGKKTYTAPIDVEFNISEWNDIKLEYGDFMPEVEIKPKQLMKESLKSGFKIEFIPKGRSFDLEMIGPKNNRFLLAVSSHVAKNHKRTKEQRTRKILFDISKMLPSIYNEKVFPVVISGPLEFEGSWSYTTDSYLDFYKEKFGFNFLTTDFKKGWEKDICNQLLELDKNVKL